MTDAKTDFSLRKPLENPAGKLPPVPDSGKEKERGLPYGKQASARRSVCLQNGLLALMLAAVLLVFGWHCPFHWITGVPCPGCGMTRALIALGNGFFTASLYWHPLLIPTLVVFAACFLLRMIQRQSAALQAARIGKCIRILILIWGWAMLLVWLWRLCFFFPGEYGWYITPLLARIAGTG